MTTELGRPTGKGNDYCLLTGEFHGQRSLLGYSPWGHKKKCLPHSIYALLSYLKYLLKYTQNHKIKSCFKEKMMRNVKQGKEKTGRGKTHHSANQFPHFPEMSNRSCFMLCSQSKEGNTIHTVYLVQIKQLLRQSTDFVNSQSQKQFFLRFSSRSHCEA